MKTEINPYIRRAWYDTLEANASIYRRVIFDYELLYIKDGHCTIEVENKIYTPQKGDIFLFRPKIEHAIHVASDTPLIQPHIHFDLMHLADSEEIPICFDPYDRLSPSERAWFRPDTLAEILSPMPDYVHPSDVRLIEQMMVDVIYVHANKASFLEELREQALFMQLLHRVLYEMQLAAKPHSTAASSTALRVKTFLDHNSRRNISIDEIARSCFVSKYHLISAFKSAYGTTPYKYHQCLRINESKYMLKFTNLSVTEIAAHMGFENIHAFSALFRHMEGKSPTDYRKFSETPDIIPSDMLNNNVPSDTNE